MDLPPIEIDLDARTLTVLRNDDRAGTVPLPPDVFAFETSLRSIGLDLVRGELALTFTDRTRAVVEIDVAGHGGKSALAGRLTVYLDQNHWSAIANTGNSPDKVGQEEQQAVAELLALAAAGKIALPVSAAHMVETTPLYGAPRQALAATILGLSRGWQMRNPMEVRRREIEAACQGRDRSAGDVITLDSSGVFATEGSSPDPRGDVPEAMRPHYARIVSVLALYDAVADPAPIAPSGRIEALGWARAHQHLAARLASGRATPKQTRVAANIALVQDLAEEIDAVARRCGGMASIQRWTSDKGADFASMPFLGRMEAVLYQRLRNYGDRWCENDLFDMHFLCCAAGYCDVVVGEQKTIGYLRQGKKVTGGALLATTVTEGVAHVRQLVEGSDR